MRVRSRKGRLRPLARFGKHSLLSTPLPQRIFVSSSARLAFNPRAELHFVGSRLLGVLLPTILLLLAPDPASQPLASSVIAQTVAQLLSFATTSPSAFKEAAAMLDAPGRELLEQSIRRAVGGSTSMQNATSTKPQISLRSF